MHAEEEVDVEEEFISAVSCMSSPTSTGLPSAKSSTLHSTAVPFYRHSHSASSRCNFSWNQQDDDDEHCSGKDDERQKLLSSTDDQPSPSLPLKSRLSSPPELVVEDHSKGGGLGADGVIPTSSSLHLGIPTTSRPTSPRRSTSGSSVSIGSGSSNRSSYRSARGGDTARSSLVNGSLKNSRIHSMTAIQDKRPASPITYHSFDQWHRDYLQPPLVTHPLQENVLLSLLESCLHYTCGLFIGIPVAIFLLAWTCLIVPFRLLFYLITRFTLRGLYRWIVRHDHCDPLWPLGGERDSLLQPDKYGDTALLLATIQGGNVDVAKIRQLLWRRLINLKDSNGYLSYAKLSSKLGRSSEDCLDAGCCVAVWAQDARFDMRTHVTTSSCSPDSLNIQTLKDLESYINLLLHEPTYGLNRKKPLWDLKSITDFGSGGSASTESESVCTLLVLRIHSILTDGCLCPLKLVSLINDGELSFDCEPRMRGDDWSQFNLLINASFHLWHAFTVVAAGPVSLLMALCRPANNPVWAKSIGGTTGRKHKDEETGDANGGRKALKATWARVPQADQLMKLERILRCSVQELLLAFVAGALRRHFRSIGVKHPPDLYASVPVTFRDYMPIGRTFPCRFVLTPVQLPLSVDGAIPRIWETQRRLCESLDSAYPRTARCLTRNAGASLPKSWLRSLISSVHRSSDGVVCFWRASGEMTLADQQIHSLLVYPPVKRPSLIGGSPWMKYAFTFVQTGNEIVLSLLMDQDVFGADPDVILRHFQYEIHGLLSHMSPRMLTLSQATFLPSPLLITRLARSPLKIVHQAAQAATGIGENVEEEEEQSNLSTDTETLEELEQLMTTVQNELQTMKTNPRGHRGDYISKLAELESKMEYFHQNIVEKLQKQEQERKRRMSAVSEGHGYQTPPHRRGSSSSASGGAVIDDESKALLDANFEPILQPLRADEEELRTQEAREGVMKLRRKRSRRMDSPTRLSPRYTTDDGQEGQRQRYYSSPSPSQIL